jgi:hypothetical protein
MKNKNAEGKELTSGSVPAFFLEGPRRTMKNLPPEMRTGHLPKKKSEALLLEPSYFIGKVTCKVVPVLN